MWQLVPKTPQISHSAVEWEKTERKKSLFPHWISEVRSNVRQRLLFVWPNVRVSSEHTHKNALSEGGMDYGGKRMWIIWKSNRKSHWEIIRMPSKNNNWLHKKNAIKCSEMLLESILIKKIPFRQLHQLYAPFRWICFISAAQVSVMIFLSYFFSSSQAECNILAGACLVLGLRFAGSANNSAFETLVSI